MDIFDELEEIYYVNEYLLYLTTPRILSEIIDEHDDHDDDGDQSEHESASHDDENDQLVDIVKQEGGNDNDDSMISIYDILPESYRTPFLPLHADRLERLRSVSLRKIGIDKKTNRCETYSWRSPESFLKYKEGGRLNDLNGERTGKLANWYHPFYAYCDNDEDAECYKANTSHEPKKVCCLLCKKLNLLQPVRNTLTRHIINHHREYSSIYCPPYFHHSCWLFPETESASTQRNLGWELVVKQAL